MSGRPILTVLCLHYSFSPLNLCSLCITAWKACPNPSQPSCFAKEPRAVLGILHRTLGPLPLHLQTCSTEVFFSKKPLLHCLHMSNSFRHLLVHHSSHPLIFPLSFLREHFFSSYYFLLDVMLNDIHTKSKISLCAQISLGVLW